MKTDYTKWIRALADLQGGRPFFCDQTPESLHLIGRLAENYQPTVIIELGTNYGLSLRRWREAAPTTPVHCVDASFEPLKRSQGALLLNLEGVTFHEKFVHDVDLKKIWDTSPQGKPVVLLYVDIHSDHQHVFDVIPSLPDRSIVIFDDVWRSPNVLVTSTEKEYFFKQHVIPQVDRTAPLEIMPRSYADYWRGGGFWGFDEVPHICAWTRANKVQLHWEGGAKLVWFQWPEDKKKEE